MSGRSAAWYWAQGVGRSNRPAPTKSLLILKELSAPAAAKRP
jgi:hypothetical protein